MTVERLEETGEAPFEVAIANGAEGSVILSVSGEVDLTTAPRLRDALDRADARAEGRLVLDLDALRFIDSSGLSVLLMAARKSKRFGRRITVVRAQDHILRLFQMTALDRTIDVETHARTA